MGAVMKLFERERVLGRAGATRPGGRGVIDDFDIIVIKLSKCQKLDGQQYVLSLRPHDWS
jgi:hypothetical protein